MTISISLYLHSYNINDNNNNIIINVNLRNISEVQYLYKTKIEVVFKVKRRNIEFY